MLIVRLNVNGRHEVADIKIVRLETHPKLRNHFYYSYQADDDTNHRYIGRVLHNYNSGAFALTQRVVKAIVAQQKAQREAVKNESRA